MKAIAAATALLSLTSSLSAIDITKYIDPTYLSVRSSFGMEFDNSNAEMDFTEARLFSFYHKPLCLFGDWNLLSYLDLRTGGVNIDGNPLAGPFSDDLESSLTRLAVPFAIYNSSDSSRWIYGAWASPALATDFQNVNSDDFFLDVAIGGAYRVSDCLYVGAGAYVSDTLNDASFVGGVGFFWVPNEDWMVTFYGPRFVARRQFGNNMQLAYEIASSGGMWNIDADRASLKYDLHSWRTGLLFRYLVANKVWLEAGAGITFANELDLSTRGGTGIYQNRLGDLGSSPYAYLGLSLAKW